MLPGFINLGVRAIIWHYKSSKFKVQRLTWLEHARATVWCNTPPPVDGHVQLAVLVKNTRRNPSTADSLLLLLPQTHHGRRWRISESFLSYTSLSVLGSNQGSYWACRPLLMLYPTSAERVGYFTTMQYCCIKIWVRALVFFVDLTYPQS